MSPEKSEPIQAQLAQPAELHRYCRRCHRRLKSAAAMKAGFGRVCLKKHRSEGEKDGSA